MEIKEYLQQIEKCDKQIDEKLEEVARLKELATKITTTLRTDAAGGGGDGDKIGNAVAKIVTLEEEITRDIDRYIDLKREIGTLISAVEDADEQTVLVKRYVNYEKWEQIALEMGFTYRNVCYIHGRALRTVEKLLGLGGKSRIKKDAMWMPNWETDVDEDGEYDEYIENFSCSNCGYVTEEKLFVCPRCKLKML